MPRTRRGTGSARAGVRVPGLYADLLRREQERMAGRQTVFYVDPKDPTAGCFRRPTHRLDALEAGKPVTVSASELTSRHVQIPEHLRPGRRVGVRWWRVTPDDVVKQANSPVVDRPARGRRYEENG
jgi:hypothetical protein